MRIHVLFFCIVFPSGCSGYSAGNERSDTIEKAVPHQRSNDVETLKETDEDVHEVESVTKPVFQGKRVKVQDGDTFDLLLADKGTIAD